MTTDLKKYRHELVSWFADGDTIFMRSRSRDKKPEFINMSFIGANFNSAWYGEFKDLSKDEKNKLLMGNYGAAKIEENEK